MLQVVITRDAFQFILHNLLHLLLDAPVVRLHRFLHAVVAILVREIGNDRNFLVGTFLLENLKSIDPLLYSKLTHQKNIRFK